jgi:hypothetical protein
MLIVKNLFCTLLYCVLSPETDVVWYNTPAVLRNTKSLNLVFKLIILFTFKKIEADGVDSSFFDLRSFTLLYHRDGG